MSVWLFTTKLWLFWTATTPQFWAAGCSSCDIMMSSSSREMNWGGFYTLFACSFQLSLRWHSLCQSMNFFITTWLSTGGCKDIRWSNTFSVYFYNLRGGGGSGPVWSRHSISITSSCFFTSQILRVLACDCKSFLALLRLLTLLIEPVFFTLRGRPLFLAGLWL